jgi:hypothetical protein
LLLHAQALHGTRLHSAVLRRQGAHRTAQGAPPGYPRHPGRRSYWHPAAPTRYEGIDDGSSSSSIESGRRRRTRIQGKKTPPSGVGALGLGAGLDEQING